MPPRLFYELAKKGRSIWTKLSEERGTCQSL
jgi:hypothetical protein